MLDIAEELMKKRRLKIREKKYIMFKVIQSSNQGNNEKHVAINQIIESDYKYFGASAKKADMALQKIRTDAKNVDVQLKQQKKLLERQRVKYFKESQEMDQLNKKLIEKQV